MLRDIFITLWSRPFKFTALSMYAMLGYQRTPWTLDPEHENFLLALWILDPEKIDADGSRGLWILEDENLIGSSGSLIGTGREETRMDLVDLGS